MGVEIPGLLDCRRGLYLPLILPVLAGGHGQVLPTFQYRYRQTSGQPHGRGRPPVHGLYLEVILLSRRE